MKVQILKDFNDFHHENEKLKNQVRELQSQLEKRNKELRDLTQTIAINFPHIVDDLNTILEVTKTKEDNNQLKK